MDKTENVERMFNHFTTIEFSLHNMSWTISAQLCEEDGICMFQLSNRFCKPPFCASDESNSKEKFAYYLLLKKAIRKKAQEVMQLRLF